MGPAGQCRDAPCRTAGGADFLPGSGNVGQKSRAASGALVTFRRRREAHTQEPSGWHPPPSSPVSNPGPGDASNTQAAVTEQEKGHISEGQRHETREQKLNKPEESESTERRDRDLGRNVHQNLGVGGKGSQEAMSQEQAVRESSRRESSWERMGLHIR